MAITEYDLKNARKYEITPKQAAFARYYVEKNGNQTQAAKAAGYPTAGNGHSVRGSELVRKRKVSWAISGVLRDAVKNIRPEDVIANLATLRDEARENKQISAAIRAEELVGRHVGMWSQDALATDEGVTITIQRNKPRVYDLPPEDVTPIDEPENGPEKV